LKIFYTDHFVLPLPPEHRFPMQKYALLHQRVAESGLIAPENMRVPSAASDAEIMRAHDPDYLHRVQHGLLTPQEIRRIGFPWSPEMVERSRRSSGATIAACRAALEDGFAANLAGGTHHAFSDNGQGFCVLNDAAIAARAMQTEGRVQRVVIIDCDVHQGNGTAAILADDPTIFTFSIHGAKNFPFHKEQSDLDVELEDGTEDAAYLAALAAGLGQVLAEAQADLAIYLAGADPFVGDRLGRLALSKAGLAARDRLVFDFCQAARLPVAITMAGGYAPQIEDIVDIHFQTIREAAERQGQRMEDGG
jgi:acetoin utilization deacetylase AcuC-like enzyme